MHSFDFPSFIYVSAKVQILLVLNCSGTLNPLSRIHHSFFELLTLYAIFTLMIISEGPVYCT